MLGLNKTLSKRGPEYHCWVQVVDDLYAPWYIIPWNDINLIVYIDTGNRLEGTVEKTVKLVASFAIVNNITGTSKIGVHTA